MRLNDYILNYGLYGNYVFYFHRELNKIKITDQRKPQYIPKFRSLQNLFPNRNAIKLKINTKSFSTNTKQNKKPREQRAKITQKTKHKHSYSTSHPKLLMQ